MGGGKIFYKIFIKKGITVGYFSYLCKSFIHARIYAYRKMARMLLVVTGWLVRKKKGF